MPLSSGVNDTTGSDLQSEDLWKIARWVAEITLYDREAKVWYERGKRILRRYKDERSPREENTARYNVLWANTQTLQPSLYARNPKPDIQRRFKDADPIGRVASDVLERSVTYFCDTDAFYSTIRQSVTDYLLPGRGTVWLRYLPHMKKEPLEITDDTENGEEGTEVIDFEEVVSDYVHPEDFGHNICRTWEEVYCGWRKAYLTREELVERFGKEKGNLPPLDYVPKALNDTRLDDGVGKSTIYELWDKSRGIAVWFHKDIPEALDLREDPLKLAGFFPFPKPLFANLCNDSLIPTAFYFLYQDQAHELDALTSRIHSISKAIKLAGAYDASAQGLSRILAEGVDNVLIPVESWAMFAEKGGIQGAISWLPLEMVVQSLQTLYETREQVKKDLHEISGIPDIVRGDSDPNETLGAQQIKTSFATNRISDLQRDVQRFCREAIRIMTDIICGHFQMDTIKKICGVRLLTNQEKQIGQQMIQQAQQTGQPPQLPPNISMDQAEQMMTDPSWEDVEALIRNEALRSFRIDIETDSTIKADQEADKESRIEFLKAMGGFLQAAQAAGTAQPEMVPVLGQMVMFGMRGFPVGKELEGAMQSALTKLEKLASNPQQKPDPEMAKIQSDSQLQQQKMQGDMQLAQQKMQMDMQLQQAKVQADAQAEQAKAQAQIAVQQHLNQIEAQRRLAEMAGEQELAKFKIESEGNIELQKAHIAAAASIEVARINAKADTGDAAEAREASQE